MIEFTALPMLLTLAAAAIPYLLLRNRVRVDRDIPWSSNRLLQEAVKVQSRKLNWLQLLILALRTLALIGLALAVANPFLKRSSSAATISSEAQLHIFFVDTSPSMSARRSDGNGRLLDEAKQYVQKRIDKLSSYDLIAILHGGARLQLDYLGDRGSGASVRRAISKVDAEATSVDLTQVVPNIQRVIAEAQRRSDRMRHVVLHLVSDFSAHEWTTDRIKAMESELQAKNDTNLEISFQHELTSLNGDPGKPQAFKNLTLRSIGKEDPVGSTKPATVKVSISNTGTSTVDQVDVQMWVDQRMLQEQKIEGLASGSTTQVQFQVERLFGRNRLLEIRLPGDQLEMDNSRFATLLPAQNRYSEVIASKQDEAIGLMAAYSAMGLECIYRTNLAESAEVANADVHVIDPVELGQVDLRLLQETAARGNHLFVWIGPRMNPRLLAESDLAYMTPSAELSVEENKELLSSVSFPSELAADGSSGNSLMLSIPIAKHWKPHGLRDGWNVVATQDNGHPFAISAAIDDGTITWIMTSPSLRTDAEMDNVWSTMIKWPTFVPLLDQLRKVGRESRTREVVAGEQCRVIVSSPDLWKLSMPDNTTRELQAALNQAGAHEVVVQRTDLLGHYSLLPNGRSSGAKNGDAISIVANLDPNEMNFESIELPNNTGIAKGSTQVDTGETGLVSLFRLLLVVAIVALLIESVITAAVAARGPSVS